MITLFYICSFVSILSARNATGTFLKTDHLIDSVLRVQHGYDMEHGEYPFVVMLVVILYGSYVYRFCTGSMISENWGLTAAHCKNFYPKFYVWYGNFTRHPTLSDLYTEGLEMITHPSYRWLSADGGKEDLFVNNDICLFRVDSNKITIRNYGRLSAVDRGTMIGLPVTYVGGGTTAKNPADDLFRQLQVGEATIIKCDKEMSSKSKYVICITPKCSNRMQRPWYGDSGGPLIFNGNIIGVCSYGIESDVIARSGYAPISPYTDWIYNVIHSKK